MFSWSDCFCHLSLISDPLFELIAKDMEIIFTLLPPHTVPFTSCSGVKFVLKKVIVWKKRYAKVQSMLVLFLSMLITFTNNKNHVEILRALS